MDFDWSFLVALAVLLVSAAVTGLMSRNKKSTQQNLHLIQALRGEDDFNVDEEIVVLKDQPPPTGFDAAESPSSPTERLHHLNSKLTQQEEDEEIDEEDGEAAHLKRKQQPADDEDQDDDEDFNDDDFSSDVTRLASIEDMSERAKYIPLRLSYEERKSLRLVNAAINVSDYTNSVDIEYKSKSKRRHMQLQNICGFLSGVISASNYEDGQTVLQDRNFGDYESFLKVWILFIAFTYLCFSLSIPISLSLSHFLCLSPSLSLCLSLSFPLSICLSLSLSLCPSLSLSLSLSPGDPRDQSPLQGDES
jgi:hypothetical protein